MRNFLQKHEMIKLFNTTKETLRHYENIGLINPTISENGYREYSNNDIQTLRELIFMKDIGFSLNEIKTITNEEINKKDVEALLDANLQHLLLEEEKIKRTIKKVKELKTLIKHEEDIFDIIQIKKFNERIYMKLQYDNEEMVSNPKMFYDQFKGIINKDYYSELNYSMTYPFENLNMKNGINSTQCLKINDKIKTDNPIIFPAGSYLCLFYKFNSKEWGSIKLVKQKIVDYMSSNNLIFVSGSVLEIERTEYSMICNELETTYELQINVKKKL